MFSKFMGFVVAVCVGIGFVGCGSGKSPIEVETYTENKMVIGYMHENYYIQVRAIVDSVLIEKISVNRGNCGEKTIDETLNFGKTTKVKIGDYTVGYAGSGCSPRDVKEVQVFTDKGTWTFNF